MALPWLSPMKKSSGISMEYRKPDKEPEHEDNGMEACASDLIKAVHSHDTKGAVEAIKAMFAIMESEPHQEGPHTEESE